MAQTLVFENIETFERWDADYYPPVARWYYDRAIGYMLERLGAGSGDLVLDAGCGLGEHAVRIARQGCRVHAIDISAVALAEARRRAEAAGVANEIHFERGDLTRLHLEDESFARVFSWGVVIHIPEVERALSELVRILEPGGRLALYVTNASAWDYALMSVARRVFRRPQLKLDRFPLGRGCWYGGQDDRLWVWQFDIPALTRYLESLGVRRTHRIPGSLTELHWRLGGAMRNLLLRINNAWYWLDLPASPCVTNLLVFEKQRSPRAVDFRPFVNVRP